MPSSRRWAEGAALLLALLPGPWARAAERAPSRVLGGLSLGAPLEAVRDTFELSTGTDSGPPPLPGEAVYRASPPPDGAAELLARFRDGRLWRLEAVYRGAAAEGSWPAFTSPPIRLYGPGRPTGDSVGGRAREGLEWSGARTRLLYEREAEGGRLVYRVVLTDLPALEASGPQALRLAQPPPAAPPEPCPGYEDCLKEAERLLASGECREARPLIEHAVKGRPGAPDGWFMRAVLNRRQGDEGEARRDLRRAKLLDPQFRLYDDGRGLPQLHGGPCADLPPGR